MGAEETQARYLKMNFVFAHKYKPATKSYLLFGKTAKNTYIHTYIHTYIVNVNNKETILKAARRKQVTYRGIP